MIVSVAELKAILGIAEDDTSEDAHLERLLVSAETWVQNKTSRYFGQPRTKTEYKEANSLRRYILEGYIDDSTAADNPSDSLDPTTSLHIAKRELSDPDAWEDLTENEDWERRGPREIMFLGARFVTFGEWEYRFSYLDGYANAPEDIRSVIIEVATGQYLRDVSQADGTIGVKSERLGDFSYDKDLNAAGSTNGTLSQQSKDVINMYRRLLA